MRLLRKTCLDSCPVHIAAEEQAEAISASSPLQSVLLKTGGRKLLRSVLHKELHPLSKSAASVVSKPGYTGSENLLVKITWYIAQNILAAALAVAHLAEDAPILAGNPFNGQDGTIGVGIMGYTCVSC